MTKSRKRGMSVMRIKNNFFFRVSKIEPEQLRHFMITEVGEKSKDKLYNYLKDLAQSYPDFDRWFYNTVIPELEDKTEKREIIIALSELEEIKNTVLTGIAILKKTKEEKKICTFRIHEDYRNQGIGTELFEECFKFLGTKKPIFTVSSDRKEMFQGHIDKYHFEEMQQLKDYYMNDSIEYVYNGVLEKNN